MLKDLNALMFRYGIVSAQYGSSWLESHLDPGLAETVNSTITGYLLEDHTVFHTDFKFFGAAVAIELLCIAFILPT